MRYRTLGRTGIEVSTHCLGTMMFQAGFNPDHDDCVRIIHAALDHGITFVDTADMYGQGESEEIVGKALRGRRDDIVLATKVHFTMGEGPNREGNSRRWILKAVEDGLRRLDTEWIDLYQVHFPDHTTDIEETLSSPRRSPDRGPENSWRARSRAPRSPWTTRPSTGSTRSSGQA